MTQEEKIAVLIIGGILISQNARGNTMFENIIYDLPTDPDSQYSTRPLSAINKIIVHHSATTSGSPEAYARHHINNRGWPGIGYHFVIQQNGKVYQVNELTTLSYHTSGQNTSGIGICLTGNYDIQVPPAAQIKALVETIKGLNLILLKELEIYGHKNFSTKSCPGDNVNIEQIKNMVYGV